MTDNQLTEPRTSEQMVTIVSSALVIANARDADGILAQEVHVNGEFLRDLRNACGVTQ